MPPKEMKQELTYNGDIENQNKPSVSIKANVSNELDFN